VCNLHFSWFYHTWPRNFPGVPTQNPLAPAFQEIPYLYIDPKLTHRNVPADFDVPLPLDVLDWGTVHGNVTRVQRTFFWELKPSGQDMPSR